ncbi:ABC transporter substrate-binding protein [Larsenimonas suaedae]|uniref:Iron-siderophore ABC transporter substrate-binding protein n=1 Tax=Larsenimonas suaedae TaxID=1851019 RepID=A0ABU1GTE7_9GAMM|nr:iron-siderophore ABC transporter substrate-binding protein [Larsenimonas suaedae]MCM2972531.1 iron-siderophore ABC transporter substrate-binding protein [Larsenimonas suaedae]MDR5894673.1 iron-siderophore ABC transporter substrate-binding protein [Larsenimonas suaedae]
MITSRHGEADQRHAGLSRRQTLAALLALGLCPGAVLAGAPESPRVVTLFQGATDTAVALGVIPVGAVLSWQDPPVYPYLRTALAETTIVGLETQPSLEDIAVLSPTLIVASRFRHQRIAPLLSRIAPVVMLEDIYRFETTLERMAQALNQQAQADRLMAQYHARVTMLRARLAAHFGQAWPLTVSLIDIRADQVRSYLPGSFAGRVLSDLGFHWTETARTAHGILLKLGGVESLPALDAGLFFVMRHSAGPAVRAHEQRLMSHPLWQRMRAPSTGRVYSVDPVAWSLSGGILGVFDLLDSIEQQVLEARAA